MNHVILGLFAVATAFTACDFPSGEYCEGTWAAVPIEEEPPAQQARIVAQVNPLEYTAVDLLFVIDDSGSMSDEQEQLGLWSSELFDVLSDGELPDLHVAVVSSGMSIPGILGCEYGGNGNFHVGQAKLGQDHFLRDVAGPSGREKNYEGSLTDAFAKMARVGDSGCGFEQPFKAARIALSGSVPSSEEFLRDDALLLIVFVTDEDDCSVSDPTLYSDVYGDACSVLGPLTSYRCFEHGVRCHDGKGSREFGERDNCRPDEDSPYIESVSQFARHLKSLKNHPGQVVLAGIYGKPHQVTAIVDERLASYYQAPRLGDVCSVGRNSGSATAREGSGATPAVRMNALMSQFAARASQSSICESELSWAMRDVGLITRNVASRSHCLRGSLVDVDIAAQGVQPACRVEAVSDAGSKLELREVIPPCNGTNNSRCFTVDVDAFGCSETETRLAFHVEEHGSSESAAKLSTLTVTCDVDAEAPPRRDEIGDGIWHSIPDS